MKWKMASTVLIFFLLSSCKQKLDYYKTPIFSESGAVNAVIEIPAGKNTKYEYHSTSKEFVIDQENGKDRVIDFLPYPANYGFIPSTLSDTSKGGDGDALDVLVIAESLKTGTIVEVIPIAILKLVDNGEQDYKIIAVPNDPRKRIVNITSYGELRENHPAIVEIVELWFLNYNKNDIAEVEGWGDEAEAMKEIREVTKKDTTNVQ